MASRKAICVVLVGILFPALPSCAGDGPRWHSEEWYQERACDPIGTRQVDKYGKQWPPYARPTGRKMTFWHKYHHAHYWPHPYVCEDREYVQNIFQQQSTVGWEVATTLHDYHFDPETNRLNSAGDAHLRWILTQAPVQYRTPSVSRGESDMVGQIRLAQVQESARAIVGNNIPPMTLKHETFLGRPAVEIDTLRRLELQSIPQPRLFVIGGAGGAGAGGGSSSGPSSAQAGGASGQPKSP